MRKLYSFTYTEFSNLVITVGRAAMTFLVTHLLEPRDAYTIKYTEKIIFSLIIQTIKNVSPFNVVVCAIEDYCLIFKNYTWYSSSQFREQVSS